MPDLTLNWWSVALRGPKPPVRVLGKGGGSVGRPIILYRKLSRSCPVSFGRGQLRVWAQSVASPVDSDNLSVVEQAIENGASGRHVAQQFAPLFDGAIRPIFDSLKS